MFHKKDSNIVVISQTKPGMCGGTDATLDMSAPKRVSSENMVLFRATSAMNRGVSEENDLRFVSAFAAPVAGGIFVFLQTGKGYHEKTCSFSLIREDIFPLLVDFVREYDLARQNGYHATTHGLPQNFGGEVDIRYAQGEKISFSNNQQAILSKEEGEEIVRIFSAALTKETVALPSLDALASVRFEETRKDGGFTEAVLTVHEDGTGEIQKKSRYEEGKVYESTKPVSRETVDAIKKTMVDTGILMWADLPDNGFQSDTQRKLTFAFVQGNEISVRDGRIVPDPIRGGFFDLQLELTRS